MIGFDEAVRAVARTVPAIRSETVSLEAAVGRVVAEAVHARTALPTARSAAMDGYACRAADAADASASAPLRLRLVAASQAGTPAEARVDVGQAVAVSTGAVVPDGADAIVVAEDARQDGDEVVVSAPARTKHIRAVGEDLEVGAIVLDAGVRIGPRGTALVASAGHDRISVVRPPSVVVLATGPELRVPSAVLSAGEVPDANAPLVAGLLRTHGVHVTLGPPVRDDRAALVVAVEQALAEAEAAETPADLVVTTGGASIGRHDVVRRLLTSEAELAFDGIRVRPGRPAMLARWRGRPWLALPGTPHAVAVLGSLLLRAWATAARTPDAGRMANGAAAPAPARAAIASTVAVLDAPLRSVPQRTVLQLARGRTDADGLRRVAPLQRSDRSRMLDVPRADALIVIPEGRDLATGDRVEVLDFADV